MKLFARKLFTGKELLQNRSVIITDGIVTEIAEAQADFTPDFTTDILAPGLLDVQIYGAGGPIFSAALSEESLSAMEDALFAEGCTGFFATLATNTAEVFVKAIEVAKRYWPKRKGNFLGLHLEGPFLNAKRKGAHPEEFIRKANLDELKSWVKNGEGVIRMMTIAPELQDEAIVDYLNSENIVISAGHSDAKFNEAVQFFDKVQAATHLYNAMPQMHHRQPGLIPAIFRKKPFTSVVADGIHVDFTMINLAKQLLGDKLFYITDAVTETPGGAYQHVFTCDRFTMPDGTLSGSCLSMLKAVQNGVEHIGIPLEESLRMASVIPGQLIGDTHYGQIAEDRPVNAIGFSEDFHPQITLLKTWVKTAS
ncbi:MAG: N-acetylglucosamine-6-phosphate deacetylase [Mucilaginibacter polytrichastri]|nr:N-acetylglucosamine-6-phosphate deacetylase [Mucilaginibacter polytrichastri]